MVVRDTCTWTVCMPLFGSFHPLRLWQFWKISLEVAIFRPGYMNSETHLRLSSLSPCHAEARRLSFRQPEFVRKKCLAPHYRKSIQFQLNFVIIDK